MVAEDSLKRAFSRAGVVAREVAAHVRCAIGSWGGWCLSLADYVTVTGGHGRGARLRRVPKVAYALRENASAVS